MTFVFGRFQRLRKGQRCAICEHEGWCMVQLDSSGEPDAAICPRVPSPSSWGQAGYFHELRPGARRFAPRRPRQVTLEPKRTYGELVAAMERGLEPDRLHRFAASLGVSDESLRRLRIGFACGGEMQNLGLQPVGAAFTFPMVDQRGRVIGVRVRLAGGKKLCVKGCTLGLFVPTGLDTSGTVYIAEGESDTAALLTLGVEAFGRPGAKGCPSLCAKFARVAGLSDVVIVADADDVGHEGAERLAVGLRMIVPRVRVVTPPVKDVRLWLRQGATREQLEALCADAVPARDRGLS